MGNLVLIIMCELSQGSGSLSYCLGEKIAGWPDNQGADGSSVEEELGRVRSFVMPTPIPASESVMVK